MNNISHIINKITTIFGSLSLVCWMTTMCMVGRSSAFVKAKYIKERAKKVSKSVHKFFAPCWYVYILRLVIFACVLCKKTDLWSVLKDDTISVFKLIKPRINVENNVSCAHKTLPSNEFTIGSAVYAQLITYTQSACDIRATSTDRVLAILSIRMTKVTTTTTCVEYRRNRVHCREQRSAVYELPWQRRREWRHRDTLPCRPQRQPASEHHVRHISGRRHSPSVRQVDNEQHRRPVSRQFFGVCDALSLFALGWEYHITRNILARPPAVYLPGNT